MLIDRLVAALLPECDGHAPRLHSSPPCMLPSSARESGDLSVYFPSADDIEDLLVSSDSLSQTRTQGPTQHILFPQCSSYAATGGSLLGWSAGW